MGSFSHPLESPWENFLTSSSNSSSNIAEGLQHAWSHLTSSFQDVATPQQLQDDKLLLNQDISGAGIYPDGSIAKSATKALTIELEKTRSTKLGVTIADTLGRDQYERWAFEACGKLSGEFLLSPPDHFGFMEDPVFQVALSTYVGQPCPLMAPVVGRFFGNNGQKLDKYGANLAAAVLPGRGHRATHNLLQSILQTMMKLGGISSEKEAANFLLDKIGEPYITRYVNHISDYPNARRAPWSIVPDIHAHNFPT